MLLSWIALSLASATPANASDDQTADALLLLTFIETISRGDDEGAEALLTPDAYIGDYEQSRRTSFDDFAIYARECKLSEIGLVPFFDSRMPIGVTWYCGPLKGERNASFWFEGQRISRIGWGEPVVIKIPTPRKM